MCAFFSQHALTVLSPWTQSVTINMESHGDRARQGWDRTCHNDPVSQTTELAVRAHCSPASPAVSSREQEQTGGGGKRRGRGEDRCRGEFRRAYCLLRGVIKIFSLSFLLAFCFPRHSSFSVFVRKTGKYLGIGTH